MQSLLSIISGIVAILRMALSRFSSKKDRDIGRDLERGAVAEATLEKVATSHAATLHIERMPVDELDRELERYTRD